MVLLRKLKSTYHRVVQKEVDVQTESDRDRNQGHQFVQLDFAAFLPGELIDFDPVWDFRDKAINFSLILLKWW